MDYRVLTETERKYTFSQSQQLSMQTGLIGYLRADFGSNGNEFWTTWNDFRKDLKTDEFKAEFDDVINGLRDGDVLSGRKSMSSYCYSTPDRQKKKETTRPDILFLRLTALTSLTQKNKEPMLSAVTIRLSLRVWADILSMLLPLTVRINVCDWKHIWLMNTAARTVGRLKNVM